MTNSGSSTESSRASGDSGFQPWHFYMLLSLAGATWAVIQAPHTHPAALLLLSAAVMSAGLVATATHHALRGFFAANEAAQPVTGRRVEFLEQEKALVLRSIKELEFDRAMGKVGDADFAELSGRLRGRAVEILSELEQAAEKTRGVARPLPPGRPAGPAAPGQVICGSCGTSNEPDARFCKQCGTKLS